MEVKPVDPTSAPTRENSGTTGTTMVLNLPPITGTNTGGSPITSYNLQHDSATATWTEASGLSPYSTSTQVTITGLTAGSSYNLRYRTRNIHEWSGWSPNGTVLMASAPDKVSTPVITLSAANVVVTWTKPANGGVAIDGYRITFKSSTGSFVSMAGCTSADKDTVTCS